MQGQIQAQLQPGEFVTFSQDGWGGNPMTFGSGAALVSERFFFVYPGGGVIVGADRSMLFTSGQAVVDYLPTSGANAPLNGTSVDPTSTASGAFGGHLTALQLDVDFADAGYLSGSATIPFGDLQLLNIGSVGSDDFSAYEGLTVRQFNEQMNIAIGTGVAAYDFDKISRFTEWLTRSFEGGVPSQFAQAHLRVVLEPTTGKSLILGLVMLWSFRRGNNRRQLAAA